jgi:arsenite-transporting ATPase
MALTGLDNADLKLILFGGKGGVGKTSCAMATAIELAKKYKTLIISTDPAHSISDCTGQQIGNGIHFIEGIENLAATEIIAEQAYSEFKKENQDELKNFLETSTNFDFEDIDDLLKLTIPGIDEVMSFKMITDFIEQGRFEKYIVDTAPTGHTLRLISSPTMLDQWIKVAAKMRWKYRYMITSFAGSYKQDKTDALLINLKKTVKRIENLLRDDAQSEFISVCIPESMAVLETGRLISSLHESDISVPQIIMNNVMVSQGCSFCKERKNVQQKYLEQVDKTYPNMNKVIVPLFSEEIKGFERLDQMRTFLFNQ